MSRILFVDDNHSQLEIMAAVAARYGYDATFAMSFDEAASLLSQEEFAVVVTDLYLGEGRDGSNLIRNIKAKNPKTPCILISGHGVGRSNTVFDKEDIFVAKPFRHDELREAIELALSRVSPLN